MKEISQNIKVAVDAIVFGYENDNLLVLLIKQKFGKFKGEWALPGGFVKNNESLQDAVHRELLEETGVKVNYLEQLYTFGDPDRDSRARIISVAYFALVNSKGLTLQANTDADEVKWFPWKKIPALSFDHREMVKLAHQRLKNKIGYEPIGFGLLDAEFPFSDLENLYCTILETEIDRRNFRKKILGFGIIDETNKTLSQSSGRPGKLFRFNEKRYNQLKKEGFLKFV